MSQILTPDQQLVLVAAELHAHAPGRYAELVRALRTYAEAQAIAMVNAPTELLVRNQGMAMQAQLLARTLAEAPSKAAKIKEMTRG